MQVLEPLYPPGLWHVPLGQSTSCLVLGELAGANSPISFPILGKPLIRVGLMTITMVQTRVRITTHDLRCLAGFPVGF
jgi:hypothetical protein